MKVALVCSHGGHLTEMEYLLPAIDGCEKVWITYRSRRTEELERAHLLENIGMSPWRMLMTIPRAWSILRTERPSIIISTGAEVAIPFFLLARLFGVRTVFVESWTRISMPTRTARIVYYFSDLFLVQWEESLSSFGPRAKYKGSIL